MWAPFPDPRKKGMLLAPFGPGCYELRHGEKLVLFGMGGLPTPLGRGTRNNANKRAYIENHLAEIEYRTFACASRQQAVEQECLLAANKGAYMFPT